MKNLWNCKILQFSLFFGISSNFEKFFLENTESLDQVIHRIVGHSFRNVSKNE